jgi:hypothetical protein
MKRRYVRKPVENGSAGAEALIAPARAEARAGLPPLRIPETSNSTGDLLALLLRELRGLREDLRHADDV